MPVQNPWNDIFSFDAREVLEDNGEFTPDIPYLNQYKNHYVFTYGTLKRGSSRNIVFSCNPKNEFCGVGVSKGNFDMLLYPEGGFPVAFEGLGNEERNTKLKGELWLVPTDTILKLDRIEANGKIFIRTYRKIWVGEECVSAFVYLGIKDFWHKCPNLLDLPMIRQNNKKYHFFHEGLAARVAASFLQSQEERGSEVNIH